MITYRHSFAKAWLHKLGNEIYINGTNFFNTNIDYIKDKFPIKPLKTFINLGEELIDREDVSDIARISFPDMKKNFGLTIYRIRAGKKRWRKGQDFILLIAKNKHGLADVPEGTIRKRNSVGQCYIEWDMLNKCVRGVGEDFGTIDGQYGNGDVTPWICYGDIKSGKGQNLRVLARHESYDEISENLFDSWLGEPKKRTYVKDIPELQVMITEDGKLLCMPYDKDYVPKIIMVGLTGAGKSYAMNSILGRAVYVYHDRAGLLNDSQDQFYEMMLPNDAQGSLSELHRIGNEPKYLPAINLYMSCPNLKMRFEDEQVSYRLTVSFKQFLDNYSWWTYGVHSWNLDGKESYLDKEVNSRLEKCRTIEEIEGVLYDCLPNARDEKKGDGIRNMIGKWKPKFENILKDEFTSNLFMDEKSTAHTWKLKMKDGAELWGHPFIISAYAGLFPIINNTQAKNRPISQKHLASAINSISWWQPEMKRRGLIKRIWIGIDELKDLLGKKGSDVYNALDNLFAQGRFPMIGFMGNLQEYTKMSESMKNNTSHLIVFDLRAASERNAIAKDYKLSSELLESMTQLKKYQCLFITKEKMVIYDKDGKMEVKPAGEGGIWKGRIVPPISLHKKPSD